MADSKISALPASTTPLAGTEVLPIVQSSATKQVSVANLTAGRAISATQLTLTTGNLIVASGQGIDFTATSSGSGTMTSELLADYEEGDWTPSQGAGLIVTGTFSSTGKYTKIGRMVYLSGSIAGSTSISWAAGALIAANLPFTAIASPQQPGSGIIGASNSGMITLAYTTNVYGASAQAATVDFFFNIAYQV